MIAVVLTLSAVVGYPQLLADATFEIVTDFGATEGSQVLGPVVRDDNGSVYGTTTSGGAFNNGTVFRIDPFGVATTVHSFNGTDGRYASSGLVRHPNGAFYGVTSNGGANDLGAIFRVTPDDTFTLLHSFAGPDPVTSRYPDGYSPYGTLVVGADGYLYGTALGGGVGFGTIYRIDANGTFEVVYSLGAGGSFPYAGLASDSAGTLYGATSAGGAYNNGIIFSFTPGSNTFQKLYDFRGFDSNSQTWPDGRNVQASLTVDHEGNVYGVSHDGGASNFGVLFKLTPAGTFSIVHDFTFDVASGTYPGGYTPNGSLTLVPDGAIYGTTIGGGSLNGGVIFRVSSTGVFSVVHAFPQSPAEGSYLYAGLTAGSDGRLYGATTGGGITGYGTAFALDPVAEAVEVLHSFNGLPSNPSAGLVQGLDGDFYGATQNGGSGSPGALYRVSPSGTMSVVHVFGGADGRNPQGRLLRADDGAFYGLTQSGGAAEIGTIYRVSQAGVFSPLHSLAPYDSGCNCYPEGYWPSGTLVQAADGALYGTAQAGGTYGSGVIFKVTTAGVLSVVHAFGDPSRVSADGTGPLAGLRVGANGLLYGTTSAGGPDGRGTVFVFDPSGGLTPLAAFTTATGYQVAAELADGSDGNLYGTSVQGGEFGNGTVFRYDVSGGTVTVLHHFTGGQDGAQPFAPLVQGGDGAFYGTASQGGADPAAGDSGTVFRLTSGGFFEVLHTFNSSNSGPYYPQGGVLETSPGVFLGTAAYGSATGRGAVYRLTVPPLSGGNAPVASNASFGTSEDTLVSGILPASDVDGDPLTYSIVTNGTLGAAAVTSAATGAFAYTPHANVSGTDTFTFRVSDGTDVSNVATVTITIAAVDDAPVASNGTLTTSEDTSTSGTLTAADVDSPALTYSIVANGTLGTAVVTDVSTGAFTYTPNPNANGTDTFTFKASDGTLDSNVATVTVTISSTSDLSLSHSLLDFGRLSVNTTSEPVPFALGPGLFAQGLGAGDLDGDGDVDLVAANSSQGSLTVGLNDGTGQFVALPSVRVGASPSGQIIVADFDSDGDQDVAVANQGSGSVSLLLNNGTGVLIPAVEYPNYPNAFSLAAGDLNGDGHIDLVVASYSSSPPLFGDGGGGFRPGSALLALGGTGPTIADFDGDGKPDVTNGSVIYLGNGDGTFASAKNTGLRTLWSAAADFDGDGTLDLLGSDRGVALAPVQLARGNGDGTFRTPLAFPHDSLSWAVAAGDFNGDGMSDAVITTDVAGTISVFLGNPATGLASHTRYGFYTAAPPAVADFDGDGVLDLAAGTNPFVILRGKGDGTFIGSQHVILANTGSAAISIGPVTVQGPDADSFSPFTHCFQNIVGPGGRCRTGAAFHPTTAGPKNATLTINTSDGTFEVILRGEGVLSIPLASNDTYTVSEDTTLTVSAPGVLANDSDLGGNTLTAGLATPPAHGALTLNSDGSFSYTPAANFNGDDSFAYRATNGSVASNVAIVSIRTTPVDDAPVAADGSLTTAEDTAAAGTLHATDIDTAALTFSIVSNGTLGTAVVTDVSTGAFTYTPNLNANGTDTFTFKATDGTLDSNVATVTVTITALDDAPAAHGAVVTTQAGTAVSGQLATSNPDGGAVTFSVATAPAQGAVTITDAATGAFTYTPNAGATGYDPFTFQVSGAGGSTTTTEMVFVVASRPQWPGQTVRASLSSGGGQTSGSAQQSRLSADGRYVAFSSPSADHVAGDTNAVYDVFVYDRLTGTTDRVSVSETGAQASAGSSFPAISASGRFVAFSSFAQLAATDVNALSDIYVRDRLTGQTMRASVGSDGTARPDAWSEHPAISADGRYVAFSSSGPTFDSTDTNSALDVFVHDLQTGQTTRISTGTDAAASDWPSISADGRYVAFESWSSTLVAGDLNQKEDIFVRDRLTGVVVAVSRDDAGVFGNGDSFGPTISADGRFVAFLSTSSNFGAAGGPAIYVKDLTTGHLTLASVSPDGTPATFLGPAPSLTADGRAVVFYAAGSQLTSYGFHHVFARDLVAGRTVRLSVAGDGTPAAGSSLEPSISADGRFVAFESDAANLVDDDTNNGRDIFIVGGVSVSPVAARQPALGGSGSIATSFVYPGTAWTATSNETWITVTGQSSASADGTVTYTVAPNASGSSRSGTMTVAAQTVTITQDGATVPTAQDGSIATAEDVVATGILSASDPNADPLTYSIVSNGALGTAVVTDAATGAFTYTPRANASGTDAFTFRVNDGAADSNVATVTVTITPVDDAPVAANGSLTTAEDTPASGSLDAADIDSAALAFSIVSNGALGTAVVTDAATGTFTYTPNLNANGTDTFTFRANDGTLDSNVATVTVTITHVDDAPAAQTAVVTTQAGAPVSGQLGVANPDGGALTFSVATPPARGTVAIADATTGAFTYTPNAGATGYDPFTFAVSGSAGSTTATEMVFVVASTPQWPGQTTRVSVASDGTQGNGDSSEVAMSADGRYVAFSSYASTLVAGDTNGVYDVFVHDRQTRVTERVSVASDGTQANDGGYSPSLSADGRYVAFSSYASNLVPGDTNGAWDVFVHDRQTGETSRVSVASDGTQGNDESYGYSLSADGRYVAFYSLASTLVANDTNGVSDVFVHDRQTGETVRVSVASDGTQGNDDSDEPSLSADGRYVAFFSRASTLVASDTNGRADVFVHDQQTRETARVSIASDGTQATDHSDEPSLSADGRYVAFNSYASNLVADDTNRTSDVFVHDRQTGATARVSVATDGTQGNGDSWPPSLSAGGRYVAFPSDASNLVAADTNGTMDVFVAGAVVAQDPVVITSAPTSAVYASTFIVSTSGGSGPGAVTFAATGACANRSGGALITMTSGTGTCSIVATKAGDWQYGQATSAPVSVSALKAAQAALTLTGAPASAVYGSTFIVAASGGTGSGAVTYSATGACTNSAGGSLVTMVASAGTCSVVATKAADADYNAAISAPASVTATKAETAVALAAAPNPSSLGQVVTLAATVAPVPPGAGVPSGTIQFFDGATAIGAAAIAGSTASLTTAGLLAGAHTLTAVYSGDANFATSTSPGVPHDVQSAAASTQTALAASPSPSAVGQSVALSATVAPISGSGSPTGTVDFFSDAVRIGGGTLALVRGSMVATVNTTSLTLGTHLLTARYNGDAAFGGSDSPVVAQTVYSGAAPAATTTTLATAPNPSLIAQPVQLTATVKAKGKNVPAGQVDFYADHVRVGSAPLIAASGSATATLSLSTLTRGAHPIGAVYTGSASFASSSSSDVYQCVECVSQNTAPTANAGSDQTVTAGDVVQLDGSQSTDPEGDRLTFSWSIVSKPKGSKAALSNPAVAQPTFVADKVGSYVIELVVNDGQQNSAPARVTITAR